jgi:uncharacterized membrane protein YfcA
MWILIGFAIGAAGTLLGVGGGVVLVPLLLHLFPEASSPWIGGVAMTMVAFNATSGSITYYFKKKIHLTAALVFMLAGLPGGVYGVVAEHYVNRPVFERIFGVAMVLFAAALWLRPRAENDLSAASKLPVGFYAKGGVLSLIIGFCASFLSIGGGVFHVPILTQVMGFPAHLATGTSHLVLCCTAWVAVMTHLWHGDVSLSEPMVWQLAVSAAVGAQVGARLSPKVPGAVLLRALSLLLFAVGLQLLFRL